MSLTTTYRQIRVGVRKLVGTEPRIEVDQSMDLEFHGNDYCGWKIPARLLDEHSVVVDVGLGEDVAFSTSLIDRYKCTVHGFDPTPRAIEYMRKMAFTGFVVHPLAVAAEHGSAAFHLPDNETHVSGSLIRAQHVGQRQIEVQSVSISDVFELIGSEVIDLLKLDVEGSEYDLIESRAFAFRAASIRVLCIEFHHRWPNYGRHRTEAAVEQLRSLGFRCAWANPATNEEFLFVNERHGQPRVRASE